jgi:hypothetical protein
MQEEGKERGKMEWAMQLHKVVRGSRSYTIRTDW